MTRRGRADLAARLARPDAPLFGPSLVVLLSRHTVGYWDFVHLKDSNGGVALWRPIATPFQTSEGFPAPK